MRYLVTPEFTQKVVSLSSRWGFRTGIQSALNRLQMMDRESLLTQSGAVKAALSQEGVYLLREGTLRIFFSIGKDEEGDYALLLDLAEAGQRSAAQQPVVLRNPVMEPAVNPHNNHSINPHYNNVLSPYYNTSLNPHYNTSLNPNYNTSINPNYNTSINPNYNTSINPHYNTTLNPHYNTTLNPHYNVAYSGPYIYDLQLRREGYLVRANDSVSLTFSEDGQFCGIVVKNGTDGYLLFDKRNRWIGYLVPDMQGGYLRFDTSGVWTGFIV